MEMEPSSSETDRLIQLARTGDITARKDLLERHRGRLRQMAMVRMDRRLLSRVDPSDVVQDTLLEAWQEISDYFRTEPLPFYPWLRQLAWQRLVDLHRQHIQAKKRSVTLELPNPSSRELANRLVKSGTAPSARLMKKELAARVQANLEQLGESDREILVLRYLEQLTSREIASVLGIKEPAVKMRHLRALRRLRELLEETGEMEE